MVRTVVAGFDGSRPAGSAVAWAVEEARRHGAQLVVRAVVDRPVMIGDGLLTPVDLEGMRSGLADRLHEAVRRICADHPVRFELVEGGAAAELVAACGPDDLLVVGTRGQSLVTGLVLGSVSRACLHHAPCPVVVVPAGAPRTGDGRVVVGVDASSDSREALLAARTEAGLRGGTVHAVHAVHWRPVGIDVTIPDDEQLLIGGKALLAAELDRAGLDAQPIVEIGYAGEVLVRHSEHADLLVLGSRGHNALAILLLGSTGDHCARHAACPVMVVRTRQVG